MAIVQIVMTPEQRRPLSSIFPVCLASSFHGEQSVRQLRPANQLETKFFIAVLSDRCLTQTVLFDVRHICFSSLTRPPFRREQTRFSGEQKPPLVKVLFCSRLVCGSPKKKKRCDDDGASKHGDVNFALFLWTAITDRRDDNGRAGGGRGTGTRTRRASCAQSAAVVGVGEAVPVSALRQHEVEHQKTECRHSHTSGGTKN